MIFNRNPNKSYSSKKQTEAPSSQINTQLRLSRHRYQQHIQKDNQALTNIATAMSFRSLHEETQSSSIRTRDQI